jgi:serine/threonine protein kinase
MLSEPYNFTEDDVDKNRNDFEDNAHEYEEGGLCVLNVNDKIKKYTVDKILGEGSYSSVWEISLNEKKYAIKITKSDKSDEEIGNNEIKILKKLGKHPYIINMEDSFIFKNSNNHTKHLCMVIDKMGCDLHILKRLFKYNNSDSEDSESDGSSIVRCLPHCLSKKITYQILDGLKHMHNKNIIHTDIKLDNILIEKSIEQIKYNKDINIKICDFGTSHFTNDKCNFGIGTIDYSAPECIIGLPYGPGIDIWAVGCIVFELVTGICLFDYTRYYEDGSDCSSGFSSESYENENDKTQIEFLLLCMMKIILGGFPAKVFKKGKYYENYFDYKGRLRFSPLFLEEDTILNVLVDEFNFDQKESKEITEFLLKLLSIDPDKRSNVNELLKDKWLIDRCE